jgi:chromosome segregation ATPase
MLTELDSLSENINRLLQIVEGSQGALAEREAQLARVRVERDEALTTGHALRAERDTLRDERDALLAKIEDAQVKLNAILEKLPPPRMSLDTTDGVTAAPDDELPGVTHEVTDHDVTHEGAADADHAAQHAEGETYER